jgi:hypothetical protein
MGGEEIRAFLTHLAVDKNAAAATQNQALNAILFLYREVLKIELRNIGTYLRAKGHKRLPTVLTKEVKMADDFSDRTTDCDRCPGNSQPTTRSAIALNLDDRYDVACVSVSITHEF